MMITNNMIDNNKISKAFYKARRHKILKIKNPSEMQRAAAVEAMGDILLVGGLDTTELEIEFNLYLN